MKENEVGWKETKRTNGNKVDKWKRSETNENEVGRKETEFNERKWSGMEENEVGWKEMKGNEV